MTLKRKWLPLLLAPVVSAFGFYVLLLGTNYYYANRAEYLLRRIRNLKLDNSSIAELKQIGSEQGFRYDETPADRCIDIACLNYVFTDNRWMHSLLGSPVLAKLGERLGLRSWFTVGDIEIQNGQVTGKIYAIQFYAASVVRHK